MPVGNGSSRGPEDRCLESAVQLWATLPISRGFRIHTGRLPLVPARPGPQIPDSRDLVVQSGFPARTGSPNVSAAVAVIRSPGWHVFLSEHSMQAAVFEQQGIPADVLQVCERELPVPGPGQVRVKMLAAPVNPSDVMTIRGTYGRTPPLPATPGYEGVGIVEAAGPGLLGRMLVGRRVAAISQNGGTWAEQAIVSARQAIPLPASLEKHQAAMFFVNPVTARAMTRDVLAVPRGEWLLLTAAGSALGRMVLRLGRQEGFKTLAIVRREAAVDELRRAGASEVLVFDADHTEPQQLREQVDQVTGADGVRYAIDPVGGPTAAAVMACLGQNGRLLLYGTLDERPVSFSPRWLMGPGASVSGFWLTNYMQSLGLLARLKLVRRISKLVGDGTLAAEVSQSFPLSRAVEAIAASEEPGRSGKVLIDLEAA